MKKILIFIGVLFVLKTNAQHLAMMNAELVQEYKKRKLAFIEQENPYLSSIEKYNEAIKYCKENGLWTFNSEIEIVSEKQLSTLNKSEYLFVTFTPVYAKTESGHSSEFGPGVKVKFKVRRKNSNVSGARVFYSVDVLTLPDNYNNASILDYLDGEKKVNRKINYFAYLFEEPSLTKIINTIQYVNYNFENKYKKKVDGKKAKELAVMVDEEGKKICNNTVYVDKGGAKDFDQSSFKDLPFTLTILPTEEYDAKFKNASQDEYFLACYTFIMGAQGNNKKYVVFNNRSSIYTKYYMASFLDNNNSLAAPKNIITKGVVKDLTKDLSKICK